jgi:hypothetical protein
MFIRAEDKELYPTFTDYVYYRFPGVTESQTIMKNMANIGMLNSEYFYASLTPGMPPLIVIKERPLKGLATSDDLGEFKGGSPVRIILAKQMVERFDYAEFHNANYFYTKNKGRAPIVGGVLLHLLCHYGYYRNGLSFDPMICPGTDFEKATYGSYHAVEYLV